MDAAKGKWRVITAYYACYHSLYALLMRCGVRSGIHDCTLVLMDALGFTMQEQEFMIRLKEDRIRTQYYLEERPAAEPEEVRRFVRRCRLLLLGLDSATIEKIRRRIGPGRENL